MLTPFSAAMSACNALAPRSSPLCNLPSRSCFPADAIVTTARGAVRISSLKMGDTVLAARPDGSTFFDDVYMFGEQPTQCSHRQGPASIFCSVVK
jgi:hypothetical protein